MTGQTPDPGVDLVDELAAIIGRYLPAGYLISLIRTWVPIGAGLLLAWAAVHWHILLPDRVSTGVAIVATAVAIAVYYAIGRLVERRWPRVGRWLLTAGLIAHQPVYARPVDVVRLPAPDGSLQKPKS